ncbi:MAG: hypothetical protein RR500_04855 [Bacilli bacterium]
MKKGIREIRAEQVQKTLNQLTKKGLDLDIATEGRSIETIAYNKQAFERFEKRVQVAKERPKVLEQVAKQNIKYEERKQVRTKKRTEKVINTLTGLKKEVNNLIPSVETGILKRIDPTSPLVYQPKDQKEAETLIKKLKNLDYEQEKKRIIDSDSKWIKDKYFKVLKGEVKHDETIKRILDKLGTNAELYSDVMDLITSEDFKGGYDSEEVEDERDFYSTMENRLLILDEYLKRR